MYKNTTGQEHTDTYVCMITTTSEAHFNTVDLLQNSYNAANSSWAMGHDF